MRNDFGLKCSGMTSIAEMGWWMAQVDLARRPFISLPVLVLRAVQRRPLRLGVHVEHALPAP